MLEPGTRLGPYVVESPLGSGGMGDVYRARDTRLDRTIALKLLAPHVAADPLLRDRLQHEARAISRLNHPHICALYDVGDAEITPGQPVSFLVLELIEGETLAHLLERGPLPVDRALVYAVQIADAVSAAHRAGVVHGDLKPANVMIAPSGVKLLDFGVSRTVLTPDAARWTAGATETQAVTAAPAFGTLQYLAPEQLEGREPDVRTDIHACGAVIYEMLTRRKAFDGETGAAVIAAIVRHTPPAITTVVPDVPAAIDHVIATCLAKNPDERWQHAGDVMRQLRWVAGATPVAAVAAPQRRSLAPLLALAAIALVVAAAAIYVVARREAASAPVYRTSILLPEGLRFPVAGPLGGVGRFALSPDGERIVFVATDPAGTQQLWLRPLAALAASPIPGTDGASSPFWAPDGRRIAFTAQGQLKTIDPAGGSPSVVTSPAFNTTGAWSRDNTIYFTPTANSPLYRVAASGGPAARVTTLDTEAGELLHRNPVLLPTGRHLLYTSVTQREGEATGARGIYVATLGGGTPAHLLIPGGTTVRVAQGQVIFLRDNALVAQALDLDALALTGEPRTVAERVQLIGPASASFSVSDTGALAYLAGFGEGSRLVWVNREGREIGTATADTAAYGDLEMSPDGARAAVSVADPSLNTRDLWIVDLARGVRTRLTFDRAEDVAPIWSPDGTRIIFASNRRGRYELFQKPASGVVTEQLLLGDEGEKYPMSWTADGETALYWQYDGEGTQLALLPLTGEQEPQVILAGRVSQGRLSPDGQWLVYDSAESGRSEVYVVPFPNPTRRWQVSIAGGSLSRWRADGREIFYAARDNKLMAAPVETRGSELIIGNAQPLFEARPVGPRAFFAPAPDGQRFLVNVLKGDGAPSITLLQNWSQAPAP